MNVLLINPPYQTITSNIGVGHQVPLGLLMVGGALTDAGHTVRLLDAEYERSTIPHIAREAMLSGCDVVMTGHAGSTPAHPICVAMLRAIKNACAAVSTIYGGVYPTYHAERILSDEAAIDYIVRGEGEATAVELLAALSASDAARRLPSVSGISYRRDGVAVRNIDRAPIKDLDEFRIGWELITNWDRYQCFGLGRAAIIQFSRGCPHRCTYCGQHGFWVSWRHRDPIRLADEIEWLYKTHDIRFITLADENPTTRQDVWREFLEELTARKLPVCLFSTIRATDIVRDAELLPLYHRAGMRYILMGIESTNPQVIQQIRKGSSTRHDYLACQLLRKNNIFSILGHIVGLEDDSWRGFATALKQLNLYDGDYLNAMYVTPHSWTQFAREVGERGVVQLDQTKWDYRHQVLEQKHLRPWELFLAVKWLELRFHLRPRKLKVLLRASNAFGRRQMYWTLLHTAMVWLAEIAEFCWSTSFARRPNSLRETITIHPRDASAKDNAAPVWPPAQLLHYRPGENEK